MGWKQLTSVITAAAMLSLGGIGHALAGAVFVSGHDAIWHANFGGNTAGAANLAKAGIDYARDGNSAKFLFIESKTTPVPGGNAREAPFLTSALGYATSEFDVMDGADLNSLANFAATLATYSAIVVASDHGGMLTAAELGFLNTHSGDILSYINSGGGVAAFAESNAAGLLGTETPFGFIPFLISSTAFGEAETGNTVTALGASLGLVNADVNGNFSHNYFTAAGGMTPVDLRNGDAGQPLTLAFNGSFNEEGVVPEPGTMAVFGLGLLALGAARRRRTV